jgi:hypothetical protein
MRGPHVIGHTAPRMASHLAMESNHGDMQLVGAGFQDLTHAHAAATELRLVLDVGEHDIEIQEIGGSPEFVNGFSAVLAGRIRAPRLGQVHDILRRHGGEVLTEVPEAWARPA